MKQRPTVLKPVGPESLASAGDFRLGDILVPPSLLKIRTGTCKHHKHLHHARFQDDATIEIFAVTGGGNALALSRG